MAGSNARTLVENPVYQQQVARIGGANVVGRAIDLLTLAISNKAEDFPIVPGFKHTRLAKTIGARWDVNSRGVKIWFKILDENTAELLYIALDE